jgi:DNA-binding NtrC family response regulator
VSRLAADVALKGILMSHTPAGDVLIVDDDPVIVELITDALSAEGYAVRRVFNGVEGLMAIAAEPPALVLLDLHMPYLNGAAVLAQVRAAHPELPMVLITASPELAAPYMELYQVQCIAKPFELDILIDCVAQCVPRSKVIGRD